MGLGELRRLHGMWELWSASYSVIQGYPCHSAGQMSAPSPMQNLELERYSPVRKSHRVRTPAKISPVFQDGYLEFLPRWLSRSNLGDVAEPGKCRPLRVFLDIYHLSRADCLVVR